MGVPIGFSMYPHISIEGVSSRYHNIRPIVNDRRNDTTEAGIVDAVDASLSRYPRTIIDTRMVY
jgi:hypothetical protein